MTFYREAAEQWSQGVVPDRRHVSITWEHVEKLQNSQVCPRPTESKNSGNESPAIHA